MYTKAGLLLVAFLTIGGGDASDTKKELAKLAGTWSVSELTYNGKDHPNLRFNMTFKDNEIVVEGNDAVKKEYARIKLTIDPSVKPKIMDFSVSDGVQKDAVIEGIYEFKDQELRICARVFGKERPTEFSSPDGASVVLMVLKRAQ
jgi:uncharacterized protein (TIGR03067 family)